MPHSRLAAIDPRVKLAWVLALLVAGLVFTDLRTLALLIASIAVVAAIGGVLGETVRRLRGLVTIIVVISLIFGFVVPGTPIVTLPLGLTFTWEGLLVGFISALRMIVFAAPLTIVVMTTNNTDLIQALMAVKLHPDFALMIVLALNFVPLYLAEFGRIADAQKARAYSLADSGPIDRLRGVVPIFVPLTLNAVDRADTVGKVLEIRGFARRQLWPEFEPLTAGSYALLAFSLLLLLVAVASLIANFDLIAGLMPPRS
jgi:energy-coupling factor transport system permease protein